MIPKIVPPLTGLTVLVTRPTPQCGVLCAEIERQGGHAIALPAIQIEPIAAEPRGEFDLAIFVSVNAVAHGARLLARSERMKIAAIGRATAASLNAAGLAPDIVPETGFDSEALLSHPALAGAALQRVVIVRGAGGRELLYEHFATRGAQVETLEVYRRVQPSVDPAHLAAIESHWSEDGVDFVTVTSVETLHNLNGLLTERGRALLATTGIVAASSRIANAARELGLRGEIITARGADDAAMLGALALWQARARS